MLIFWRDFGATNFKLISVRVFCCESINFVEIGVDCRSVWYTVLVYRPLIKRLDSNSICAISKNHSPRLFINYPQSISLISSFIYSTSSESIESPSSYSKAICFV
jgi:hypothetical protein